MAKGGIRQWVKQIATVGVEVKRNKRANKLLTWVKPISLKPPFSPPTSNTREITKKIKNLKPVEEILPENFMEPGIFASRRCNGMGACSFIGGVVQPTTRRCQKANSQNLNDADLFKHYSLLNGRSNWKTPKDGPLSSLHASRMSASFKQAPRVSEACFDRLIMYKRSIPKK
ncbi:uncharacterized protein LOC111518620 [Drosophila willistoni]|uniref:uncharacterized protein LOC111518620 n=1 Tax=Drosophila willistoni TaxID=7260 RepID=UPI000C26DA9C|nr:uncharacterized protein LOC111518620 [Drosophila willistoni]